jgi:hypothetical protein
MKHLFMTGIWRGKALSLLLVAEVPNSWGLGVEGGMGVSLGRDSSCE